MEASDGSCSASLDFYGQRDTFQNFAHQLCSFPQKITDEVVFELGSPSFPSAVLLLLRAFCYESNGSSAIQVKMIFNGREPYGHHSHFFIRTEPAAINTLERNLEQWNPETNPDFEWENLLVLISGFYVY